MNHYSKCIFVLLSIWLIVHIDSAQAQDSKFGLFRNNEDIGTVAKQGSVVYNDINKSYTVVGGGENMWFTIDAFHFVWKLASGDISLASDIRWIGMGGNPHRKACLLIRQSLDPGSPYADAVLHGDGLTSLQYRDMKGGLTHEIQSNMKAPLRLRIEKKGDYVSMSIAGANEKLHSAGGSFKIIFTEPFYIGLGVSAHDNNVSESAVFSNVEIINGKTENEGTHVLESTLETLAIASTDRRVAYTTRGHIEAPNWSRDGKYFIFNREGCLYKLPVIGSEPKLINTGFAIHCNNDHGISPDGNQLAISDQTKADGKSLIYILPIDGGTPRLITKIGSSYWHGWSPDGKTLAYCAERNGPYNIYSMSVEGGEEKRLTASPGLDDGPDYSPDGQCIYFNSDRTGLMQIWKMKTDGSSQQQVTSDEYNNWFAHPSPDGKWIVFLSYEKDVKGHPANKDVMLRIMPVDGGEIKILAKLFGGQGTINVPSWSPDSKNIAFVSYSLVNP